MISAIGPFGVEQGLQYATTNDGHFIVRIHNTNTGKIIHSVSDSKERRLPFCYSFSFGDLHKL